jgi:GTP:adenosylcobinamide-phosphate guanylyltransferase
MATFTSSQKSQLKLVLGYASSPNLLTTELDEDREQVFIDKAIAILADLASIDQQLIDARSDSMAKNVGSLRLSYTQHVAHLKSEGTRALTELSNVLGISIVHNKYRGASVSTVSYW